MSSNGKLSPSAQYHPLAAADLSFTRIANRNNGESSSQAGSRSSVSTRDGRDEERRRSQDSHSRREMPEHRHTGTGHRKRTSGGFLLDSAVMNGSPRASDLPHRNGKQKALNGELHVDKRRNPASRLSVEGSGWGSPLSCEMSLDGPVTDQGERQTSMRPPNMDPAQLVQMALELSESRRRHVSGGLQLPSPGRIGSRRSSGLRPADTARRASSQRQRASYASNEPPRDMSARYSTALAQDGQQDHQQDEDMVDDNEELRDVARNFTPATLSRAERARKYFELASEHRRLLQHLPPLKPDADAPGNHTFVSTNSPGSAHPQISKVQSHLNNKHSLGRSYNPLQSLRNRRLRNRERQALPAPPEAWQDTERIRHWVDDVESAAGNEDYRATPDHVELPRYAGDDGASADARETGKGYRRTDTASSIITRSENGWSIEPSELLADAYWTERGRHKELLENRHGSPIFRRVSRLSTDKPRRSRDAARTSNELQKAINETDEVPFHKRAHRGPHLLPRRHGKLPRSGSVSSVSTDGGRPLPYPGYGAEEYENTGPLEKHMQHLIAKYEKGELMSPVLVSPDDWDSRNTSFPIERGSTERQRRDTLSQGNGKGRLSVDTARGHQRARSADGRVGSIDGGLAVGDRSEPTSPAMPGFRPSLDIDRSAQQHQGAFARQKSKLHKLPLFRSHSKERNGTDRIDFAETGDMVASTGDNDNELQPRASRESARPSFIQRHRTTESVTSSVNRQGTGLSSGSGKDGSSTVGRLLKGGRIGELVRNESARFGDRFRGKERLDDLGLDTASEGSESEAEMDTQRKSFGDDEPSPRTSVDQARARPKYFLPNLPSFRSPAARNIVATPGSMDSDPIARQQRAQKEAGRSSRFDRLAPPRINLPADEEDLPTNPSDGPRNDDRRKSYGFLGAAASSNASRISFAETGPVGQRSSRLRSHGGQRHWSISDEPHAEQLSKISARDIARVRALLLSSGVKAREIQRRANAPREKPLAMYAKICEMVGKDVRVTSKREEHLVASRLLSENLASTLGAFEQALQGFQSGTAKDLTSRLDALGRKAADQLTTTVHDTSDDADAFIVELTTKSPQDVKRVDDAVDDILRERRRQFRLLRRAGFKLLEWLVLGIMWWVWFVVVLFNMGRRLVVGFLAELRWLFWF